MVALTLHFLDGGNINDYSYFDILKDLVKFLTVQLFDFCHFRRNYLIFAPLLNTYLLFYFFYDQ